MIKQLVMIAVLAGFVSASEGRELKIEKFVNLHNHVRINLEVSHKGFVKCVVFKNGDYVADKEAYVENKESKIVIKTGRRVDSVECKYTEW